MATRVFQLDEEKLVIGNSQQRPCRRPVHKPPAIDAGCIHAGNSSAHSRLPVLLIQQPAACHHPILALWF